MSAYTHDSEACRTIPRKLLARHVTIFDAFAAITSNYTPKGSNATYSDLECYEIGSEHDVSFPSFKLPSSLKAPASAPSSPFTISSAIRNLIRSCSFSIDPVVVIPAYDQSAIGSLQ
jgi:hypothetical protein